MAASLTPGQARVLNNDSRGRLPKAQSAPGVVDLDQLDKHQVFAPMYDGLANVFGLVVNAWGHFAVANPVLKVACLFASPSSRRAPSAV